MGQATEYTETIEITVVRRVRVQSHGPTPGLSALREVTVDTEGQPLTDWAPVIDLASRRSAA